MVDKINASFDNNQLPNHKIVAKDKHVSKRMRGNKSKNTKPELQLRKLLTEKGIRGYRVCYSDILGKPDVTFVRKKIAIFVHGCFWHSCPHCSLKVPINNNEFWLKKLANNKERDKKVSETLLTLGWQIVIIWECKLKKSPNNEIERIKSLITSTK